MGGGGGGGAAPPSCLLVPLYICSPHTHTHTLSSLITTHQLPVCFPLPLVAVWQWGLVGLLLYVLKSGKGGGGAEGGGQQGATVKCLYRCEAGGGD